MDRRAPRRIVALYTAVVALVVLGGCATRGATGGSSVATTGSSVATAVSASDAQTIDALFTPYAQPGVPGAAVAVIDGVRAAF